MAETLDVDALDLLFREARTYSYWLDKPVDDALLQQAFDLAKLGPTSANTSPMRVVFVKSPEAKKRLEPALMPMNVEKTMTAPVCAIIAYDMKFYEHIPLLYPINPGFANFFTAPGQEEFTKTHAFRNATLQAGYFILAARSLGLDTGPMSGFNNAKVDEEFFPDGRFLSNFLINLGYGDKSKLHPRLPRMDFDQACQIL